MCACVWHICASHVNVHACMCKYICLYAIIMCMYVTVVHEHSCIQTGRCASEMFLNTHHQEKHAVHCHRGVTRGKRHPANQQTTSTQLGWVAFSFWDWNKMINDAKGKMQIFIFYQSKYVTWCFMSSQPVQLYQGNFLPETGQCPIW